MLVCCPPVIDTHNATQERLYTRVANMLSTVSMVAALLSFVTFVFIKVTSFR